METINSELVGYVKFDYEILPKLALGAYIGYRQDKKSQYGSPLVYDGSKIHFGLNTKYYLLDSNVLLRPYFCGQLGCTYSKYDLKPEYYDIRSAEIDCGIYAGAQFRIYKSLKAMFEVGYGKNSITNFGIAYCL
ncbi:hypothetical protein [Labilibacter marinus]|uniref:hypothetical protein n=1 Tax=Labilibacter marinus TaxID=1477105 RepID=UPI00117B3819|nr:hypothetical protein [Labilibacter marinus]